MTRCVAVGNVLAPMDAHELAGESLPTCKENNDTQTNIEVCETDKSTRRVTSRAELTSDRESHRFLPEQKMQATTQDVRGQSLQGRSHGKVRQCVAPTRAVGLAPDSPGRPCASRTGACRCRTLRVDRNKALLHHGEAYRSSDSSLEDWRHGFELVNQNLPHEGKM